MTELRAALKKRRAFFLRQLYQWHWISSGICLIGMILFAVTGITLNHAGKIEATPSRVTLEARLPDNLMGALEVPTNGERPLPEIIRIWLQKNMKVSVPVRSAEWSGKEVYMALPRPGGDAWISIERGTGIIIYESTSRGWIAYLNDLHKGRNTGAAWSWFIDFFAAIALVFCATGLLLLHLHAVRRPATWPIVGAGFVLPLLILLIFIHH